MVQDADVLFRCDTRNKRDEGGKERKRGRGVGRRLVGGTRSFSSTTKLYLNAHLSKMNIS